MNMLAAALYVTACLQGSLHGQPKDFWIRAYSTIEACNAAHDRAIMAWLDELRPFRLDPRVAGSRCGPAETDGDDV